MREHVVLDQRARVLQALVEVVAEHGFAGATIGLVVARAGVSTRTFYQLFENLETCLTAVVDRGFAQAEAFMAEGLAREEYWLDGVRAGLGAWLEFFDREPGLARVCFVEALAAGPGAVEHRERRVLALTMVVAARLGVPESEMPPFTLRSVVALVLGAIHAQMVLDGRGSLLELLGPLMGVIGGLRLYPEQAAREIERGKHAGSQLAERARAARASEPAPGAGSLLEGLGVLGSRRERECLLFLAEQNGRELSPSNREIAAGIGVTQQAQISRLLSSLLEENLVVKRSEGAGKRNKWRLTPRGEEIARVLSEQGD
jgi:AcrR family transcriptional regulator